MLKKPSTKNCPKTVFNDEYFKISDLYILWLVANCLYLIVNWSSKSCLFRSVIAHIVNSGFWFTILFTFFYYSWQNDSLCRSYCVVFIVPGCYVDVMGAKFFHNSDNRLVFSQYCVIVEVKNYFSFLVRYLPKCSYQMLLWMQKNQDFQVNLNPHLTINWEFWWNFMCDCLLEQFVLFFLV